MTCVVYTLCKHYNNNNKNKHYNDDVMDQKSGSCQMRLYTRSKHTVVCFLGYNKSKTCHLLFI